MSSAFFWHFNFLIYLPTYFLSYFPIRAHKRRRFLGRGNHVSNTVSPTEVFIHNHRFWRTCRFFLHTAPDNNGSGIPGRPADGSSSASFLSVFFFQLVQHGFLSPLFIATFLSPFSLQMMTSELSELVYIVPRT